jgi:RNase P/RNase MRP subunit POP5
VRIVADKAPTRDEFQEALLATAARFFGKVGIAKMRPSITRYDEKDWTAIIGARSEGVEDLRASLALITEIAGVQAAVLVIRSGGTIRSLVKDRKVK